MKAIVQNGYGSIEHISVKEVEPPLVEDDQVLVEVHASSVNAGDLFTVNMGATFTITQLLSFGR